MTIAEVSQKFEVSADTLRYYERIGLIPPVHRKNGIRNYDEQACNWVQFIKCMRGAGLPIEILIEYVSLFQQGTATISARKQLLIEQRRQLAKRIADMEDVLDRLDKKIDGYEERMAEVEEKLRKPEDIWED
jgi:DNA-binding transcriptional MerR regulator